MAPSFSQIPSTLRVPLFWAEVDSSAASTPTGDNPKSLLVGQKKSGGSATANQPIMITSEALAQSLFGFGSELHRMVIAYLAQDPFGELWAIPLTDGVGVAGTLTLTIAGTATESGTIHLYLAGRHVEAAVPNGTGAAAVVTAMVAAITDSLLPLGVTAVDGAGDTVIITHDHHGTIGNSYDVRASYYGPGAGERLPAGITVTAGGSSIEATPAVLASGATDPSFVTAIANMGDEPFDYVAFGVSTTTVLGLIEAELLDRWSAIKQVYGLAFTTVRDTVANLIPFGDARNSPYVSILGHTLVPSCNGEIAAAYCGVSARELRNDPARPLQSLSLSGILPPRIGDVFNASNRNSLLYQGISVAHRAGGAFRLTAAITEYQENSAGNADDSYLYVETLATLQYVLRYLKSRIESKYPNHKLANDGTRYGAGQAIVTPSIIRGELVAAYLDLMELGLVENIDAFVANLTVTRNSQNPNRLDVLYPPDLVNGLRVFALLMQFRLQYAAN